MAGQEFDGLLGHFRQGGLFRGGIQAVDFRFQVVGGKEAKDFRLKEFFKISGVVEQIDIGGAAGPR